MSSNIALLNIWKSWLIFINSVFVDVRLDMLHNCAIHYYNKADLL